MRPERWTDHLRGTEPATLLLIAVWAWLGVSVLLIGRVALAILRRWWS